MTISRLNHVGLRFGWLDHEDHWNTSGVDANWQWIDALLGGAVTDVVSILPSNPGQGAFYLLRADAGTGFANRLALWVITLDEEGAETGAWDYFTPQAGQRIYSLAGKYYLRFDGTAWQADTTASLSFFAEGTRDPEEMVCKFLSPTSLSFPSGLNGSFATCEQSSPVDYTLAIRKNGTLVGTIKFLAGATAATLASTGFSLVGGDALTFHTPEAENEDFSGLSVTMTAVRRSV